MEKGYTHTITIELRSHKSCKRHLIDQIALRDSELGLDEITLIRACAMHHSTFTLTKFGGSKGCFTCIRVQAVLSSNKKSAALLELLRMETTQSCGKKGSSTPVNFVAILTASTWVHPASCTKHGPMGLVPVRQRDQGVPWLVYCYYTVLCMHASPLV
ncbi:hypothetical protein VNO77_02294 [Canavalia gladiata]|uniref:Uncharacterized protein n=1 Tax=Canavalia gladiata TaxID=3824 RepID=A0AAN9MSQ3_CANGL